MSETFKLADFVPGYLAEAEELLALASRSLLALEASLRKGEANSRAARDAFRALHTIKGLSAMVALEPIVAIAHRMETSLREADQGGRKLALPDVDVLLEAVRAIEQRVRAVAQGKPPAEPPQALLESLDAIEPAPSAAGPAASFSFALDPALLAKLSPVDRELLHQGLKAGKRALQADFMPSAARARSGITITLVREKLGRLAEIVKVLPVVVPRGEESPAGLSFTLLLLSSASPQELEKVAEESGSKLRQFAAPLAPREASPPGDEPVLFDQQAEIEAAGSLRTGLVRVEISRLDDALERLSSLIVTRFRLARAVADLGATGADVRNLTRILQENARQVRDLRAAVLHVRMVPMADVLERVPLLVRGLRSNTGKLVRLEMDSGKVEVDKAVAERLFPAIVHLVRNAVDHALESPEERGALGKPEEGVLSIVCIQRSNDRLELSVADDGRGVDREQVARRAGRAVPRDDAGLLDLLCLRGLSTREKATTTSGRGMGMDIVKKTALDLGGELLLRTARGKGSTFVLRVPLTITIVDTFSFGCGGERFLVPVSMVEEIVEVDPAQIVHGPSPELSPGLAGGGRSPKDAASMAKGARPGMIRRRGRALPLLSLSEVLGLPAREKPTKALVVRRGGEAMGFAVHHLLGQQEVVVRPLKDALVDVVGVSGATDLGDGKPTLVLDLVALGSALLAEQPREKGAAA
jgi:two-component system chemotaxis sensor kinase CheA